MELVTRSAVRLLRWTPLQDAAFLRAAKLGRGLVLLYHRLGHEGPQPHQIVPTVPVDLFRRHLDALRARGQIVPLTELLEAPARDGRPCFALTFDDDEPCHAEVALPVLREEGVAATFFLGGRALHGRGAFWWQVLEKAIARSGMEAVTREMQVLAESPVELAARVEALGLQEAALALDDATPPDLLDAVGIRALADAGMGIGFHTLGHRPLVGLGAHDLGREFTEGRARLAECAGAAVDLVAYPHGKADVRVARAAEEAGYRAGFTTRRRPVASGSDPFLLGRWEPGLAPATAFAAALALRISLPGVGRRP